MKPKILLSFAALNLSLAFIMLFLRYKNLDAFDLWVIGINLFAGFYNIYSYLRLRRMLNLANIGSFEYAAFMKGYRVTEITKQNLRNPTKLWQMMEAALTKEEIKDWHRMENISPGVGLTSYEQERLLKYAVKAGLIEKIPEEQSPCH